MGKSSYFSKGKSYSKKTNNHGKKIWNKPPRRNSDSEDDVRDDTRHKGSIDLDLLKQSEEYSRRVLASGRKQKFALSFGYLGSNYQGLQINPDCKSVEAELERALFLAGAIEECNFGNLYKIQWTRAARTDRGVHAVSQCCAMKLHIERNQIDTFIAQINDFLPKDIRLHTMTKVTKHFNAKRECSERLYHYILPTYVLNETTIITNILTEAFNKQGEVTDGGCEGGYAEQGSTKFLSHEHLQMIRPTISSYRIETDKIERFREILNFYVGTKSYHNFTTGKTIHDANSKRYVKKFECSEPFVDEIHGCEWVLLSVLGQSFLLNQIRKMVGLAIEVIRGDASIGTMKGTFGSRKIEVPMAPSLGLYLCELHFDHYNHRQREELKDRLKSQQKSKTKFHKKDQSTEHGDVQSIEMGQTDIQVSSPSVALNSAEEDPGDKKVGINDSEEESGEDNDNEERKDDANTDIEIIIGEPIDWNETSTKELFDNFRRNVIWPHIFEEESRSLRFMFYLDYLRVKDFKCLYDDLHNSVHGSYDENGPK